MTTTLPNIASSSHRPTKSTHPTQTIPSSPPPIITKPRAKPTVTPRSFRRFFAPRNTQSLSKHIGLSGRNALGDITGSGGNRLYRVGKRRLPKADSVRLFDADENPELGSNNLRSRKRSICSRDSTPERSSPLKRFKKSSFELALPFDGLSDLEEVEEDLEDSVRLPTPVVRSKYRGDTGHISRRELGFATDAYRRPPGNDYPDWRSQVADFYSGPQDIQVCRNITAAQPDHALPFCTAACNTNSLVAVGDEEGGVRLLETEQNGKVAFKTPFLTFRPHINAILDLAFSPDDGLLATASGDQSSQIIDMRTQQTVFEMRGHISSVKQVRFQPGSSGSVIATSSRDGSIQMWDLRCKSTSTPVSEFKVMIGGNDDSVPTTWSQGNSLRGAACVNTIREAHAGTWQNDTANIILKAPNSRRTTIQARNEVSITAISFLSEKTPHLILSGSEANATVKLWDLRMKQYTYKTSVPLSTTRQPEAHTRHRQFGLTSITVGGDGSRLYTLCKDNTVYVYSTNHLIMGSAPEIHSDHKPKRRGDDKEGLGPLYGFRHPKLKVSTFYVKSAIRPAKGNMGEVLAVGSSDSCAVLFPTDERCFKGRPMPPSALLDDPTTPTLMPTGLALSRSNSNRAFTEKLHDTIPVYQHGAALVGGHEKEVTCSTWSSEGQLVTVGDDYRCRVWREDEGKARDLRQNGETGGNRWCHGWADLGRSDSDWDDEEFSD